MRRGASQPKIWSESSQPFEKWVHRVVDLEGSKCCALRYGQAGQRTLVRAFESQLGISVPMLLTTNPIGSVLAHASMHVAATTHAYQTPTFLPPQVGADGTREALRTP